MRRPPPVDPSLLGDLLEIAGPFACDDHPDLLDDVCCALALDPGKVWSDPRAVRILIEVVATTPYFIEADDLRAEVAAELGAGRLATLFDALLVSELELFRVDLTRGEPIVESCVHPRRHRVILSLFGREGLDYSHECFVLGRLLREGHGYLLSAIAGLDESTRPVLLEAIATEERDEIIDTALRLAIDPRGEMAAAAPRPAAEVLSDFYSARACDTLEHALRGGWHDPPVPGGVRAFCARLPPGQRDIAHANLGAACAAQVAFMPTHHEVEFEHGDVLDAVLPRFGLTPDLAPVEFTDDSIDGHRAAVLMLPPEHPVWSGLTPQHPVKSVVEWADVHGDQTVLDARRRYLWEARWWAMVRQPPLLVIELSHALHEVFDPAFLETPIAAMTVSRGTRNRLDKALASLMPTPATTLGEIPRPLPRLLEAPGFGNVSFENVVTAVFRLARAWRRESIGLTEDDLVAASGVQSDTLSDGLDELALLFEDSEPTE